MITYFTPGLTAEQIKSLYHDLARTWHPDTHPGASSAERLAYTATMQDINAQYAHACAKATRAEKPGKTEAEYADLDSVNEAIRAAIEKIINLEGLIVEVCGLWVWVGGDTRTHKDALKAAAYRWAPKKEKWYFAGVPAGGRGRFSMDDIRARYGSKTMHRADDEKTRRPAANLA